MSAGISEGIFSSGMVTRAHGQTTPIAWEDGGDHAIEKIMSQRKTLEQKNVLDLVAQFRPLVLKVHHHSCSGKNKRNIHICILQPNASMGATAIHEEIFRVGVCFALRIKPSLWDEIVSVRVNLGIMQ